MKVNKNKLQLILFTHCKVNLLADGEMLKLRYVRNPDEPEFHVWFCNGENTGLQVTALLKKLLDEHKEFDIKWKRQF
ncbi:hypothetical protein UT300003_32760 [Clostridium sardiniense]